MAQLVAEQLAYIQKQSEGKTEAQKVAARANDKAAHAELNALRALRHNAECFDCTAKKPGWAVLPHGVYVCIDCAQVHRNIGRHVSQTKAINTGTYLWFDHELPVMRSVGNAVAARAFGAEAMAAKPSRDAPPAGKAAYAHAKYVEHRWGPPQYTTAVVAAAQREPYAQPAAKPSARVTSSARAPPKPAPKPAPPPSAPLVSTPPTDWDSLFDDDAAAPSVPVAPAAAPARDQAASEVLRLFDPLSLPTMAPTKVQATPLGVRHEDDAFFAQFGL
jgi:hypothetical protein